VLITGAAGPLGQAFAQVCATRGIHYQGVDEQEVDITDPASVERVLASVRPWAIINADGFVEVDEAEQAPGTCLRINGLGPAILAGASSSHGIALLTFSSDLVFDGCNSSPYVESNPPAPLSIFGRSKAEAERGVLENLPSALVVRTSAFFGPWDEHNFSARLLRVIGQGKNFLALSDAVVSPTYLPDLVHTSLDLLIDGEQGIWHLANAGEITWLQFGRLLAEAAGYRPMQVVGRTLEEMALPARRPRYSALGSERGMLLPALENAVERFSAAARG
jgi:dTDP-4-dehydrorhamnose reductase